jgi:large subunit ribosomal protein L24
VTFNPSPATAYNPGEIPASLNTPSISAALRDFADTYIDKPEQRANPQTDSIMPIHLAEELSPRFSRAKITQGWNERREIEAAERAKFAADAVGRWEAAGRDAGLGDVLRELSLAGGDVRVRGRTRKEVREAAEAEFDALVIQGRKETKEARRLGQVWAPALGQYTDVGSERGERRSKRSIRLARKAAKQEARMANLEVEAGKNTVLPPAA